MKVKIKKGQAAYTSGAVHLEGEVVDLPAVYARSLIEDGKATEVATKDAKDNK